MSLTCNVEHDAMFKMANRKGQMHKQRSTKHTQKTEDRALLKNRG
jgi:hypothetical protein